MKDIVSHCLVYFHRGMTHTFLAMILFFTLFFIKYFLTLPPFPALQNTERKQIQVYLVFES